MPENLRRPNPVVKATISGCRGLKPESDGLVYYQNLPAIDLRVSRKQFRRAMRIAHGFLTAVEARGHSFVQVLGEKPRVELHVNGAIMCFDIHESVKKVPTRVDKSGYQHHRDEPAGTLSLFMRASRMFLAYGRTHRDGRTFPLESRLALAIPDLEQIAKIVFEEEEVQRQKERQREAERRRHDMARKVVDRRVALRDTLKNLVERVELIEGAKMLLVQLEQGVQPFGNRQADELANWVRFAVSRLDHHDGY